MLLKAMKSKLGLFILLLIAGIFLWLSIVISSAAGWNPFLIRWNFSNTGAFGDSFGPLSTMMGAAAAIGAFLAWHAQREELKRVRANDEQNKADAAIARDEQTFFNLVKFFQDNVSFTDIQRSDGPDKRGQDAFGFILSRVDRRINQGISSAYSFTFNQYVNDLGHYFRTVYNIVNFVDKSNIENKYFYIKILRSLLSNSEIALIGLNCEHGEGKTKFKPLVEKYALLKNLSSDLVDNYEFKNCYSTSAFLFINKQ